MMNICLAVSFLVASSSIMLTNPYMMAGLFWQMLIVISLCLGNVSKFIGYVMFLIYVGGLMILLSYCVMLLPYNKFMTAPMWFLPALAFIIPISINVTNDSYSYGLLYSASAIFILGILLFLVMLAIVSIIDYSLGMMKST